MQGWRWKGGIMEPPDAVDGRKEKIAYYKQRSNAADQAEQNNGNQRRGFHRLH